MWATLRFPAYSVGNVSVELRHLFPVEISMSPGRTLYSSGEEIPHFDHWKYKILNLTGGGVDISKIWGGMSTPANSWIQHWYGDVYDGDDFETEMPNWKGSQGNVSTYYFQI